MSSSFTGEENIVENIFAPIPRWPLSDAPFISSNIPLAHGTYYLRHMDTHGEIAHLPAGRDPQPTTSIVHLAVPNECRRIRYHAPADPTSDIVQITQSSTAIEFGPAREGDGGLIFQTASSYVSPRTVERAVPGRGVSARVCRECRVAARASALRARRGPRVPRAGLLRWQGRW
ncbi:hypothetical protein C8R44DRAFT_799384 [Mycena epipterygia]|nr:hypothetical protein C8R44DRAFT_799384 [Mycena epipterygia]